MTAQEPMATKVLARERICFNFSVCLVEEIAPSTKATSIGPKGGDFLKALAYLKSILLVQSCQCWFKTSSIKIVESSEQVKVNQPMISFVIDTV